MTYKVKFFWEQASEFGLPRLETEINNFLSPLASHELVDIKISEQESYFTAFIIYKDNS